MIEFVQRLFSMNGFMPHGHCYLWKPELLWMHVVSDALIFLAYCSIPLTLWLFARRKPNLPFHWIFVAFGVFILSCGTTHLMEIITVWKPYYWLAGLIKVITAVASITTAIGLVGIIPQALALRSADELEDINRRLQIAEAALRGRVAELTYANHELEAFSYTVSHDLRAPLRAIDGYTQVILQDCGNALPSEAGGYFQRIRANTQKMGRLIDDLLSLAQLGRRKLECRPVALGELVREAIDELAGAKPKTVFTVGDLPTVVADRSLLGQAVCNLIGNAVKYSSSCDDPRIEVTACYNEAKGAWVISVTDNGIGFDEQYSDKLFKVFERLHDGDARFEGTGVGLSIVARVISRHRGEVWAQGRPGEGATFSFSIPDSTRSETPP